MDARVGNTLGTPACISPMLPTRGRTGGSPVSPAGPPQSSLQPTKCLQLWFKNLQAMCLSLCQCEVTGENRTSVRRGTPDTKDSEQVLMGVRRPTEALSATECFGQWLQTNFDGS